MTSAILDRGLKAHQEGRTEDAVKAYQEVLDRDPRNKFAFYNLGLIDQTARHLSEAEHNYREALSIDPDYPPALFNLATVLSTSHPEEAADLYRHVVGLQPQNAAAHLNLGFVLRSLGRREEGEREIAEALRLDRSLESRLTPTSTTRATGTKATTTTR